MKKKVPLLFTLLILFGCSSNSDLKFAENTTVELGSDFDSCSLVRSVKGKSVSDSDIENRTIKIGNYRVSCSEIDTTVAGSQKIYFNLDGQMYALTVNVADTTPPEISILDNIDSTNPLDYVKATDPSGVQSLKYVGLYDPNTPGEYTVQIVATDNEGNTSQKDLTLSVRSNGSTETEEKEKNQ